MTYRELILISEENHEKIHDKHEQEAMYAIFNAAASRGKGKKGKIPQIKDLYDRNASLDGSNDKEDGNKIEDVLEKQQNTEEWLSQFDLSNL